VLVGLPGSGKSTLCQLLDLRVWAVVNQDTLKNRQACERAARAALASGKRVAIDRTNATPPHRKVWLDLLDQHHAAAASAAGDSHAVEPRAAWCLELQTPRGECVRRCEQRTGHPTVAPADGKKVVGFVAKEYQPPTAREGLAQVVRVGAARRGPGSGVHSGGVNSGMRSGTAHRGAPLVAHDSEVRALAEKLNAPWPQASAPDTRDSLAAAAPGAPPARNHGRAAAAETETEADAAPGTQPARRGVAGEELAALLAAHGLSAQVATALVVEDFDVGALALVEDGSDLRSIGIAPRDVPPLLALAAALRGTP